MKQPYNTTIYNTALYMRLSRDDELQGESGSIQTQRMMLRQYAAEHGLNVIDEYIDDGWSGTNFDRPDFQRMIDDIEDGKINCVVTKDLSRLGRNYILTGQYTEIDVYKRQAHMGSQSGKRQIMEAGRESGRSISCAICNCDLGRSSDFEHTNGCLLYTSHNLIAVLFNHS